MHAHEPSLYIGRTNGRPPHRTFGIKHADRLFHTLILGRTGAGKTTLIETMALQDIRRGHGVCVIDPHGDLVARLVIQVPLSRYPDLIYIDLPNLNQPFAYNPLRRVSPSTLPLAAGGLLDAMKKIWMNEWGVRMEHVLRNTLFALLEYGKATLPDVLRMLTDERFRGEVLKSVSNAQVRQFWLNEYPKYNPRYRQEAIAPIQNKIGAFLSDPRLRRLFTNAPTELRVRRAMDEGKIILVNLAKGALGDDSATLLGAFLISTIALAAFSRVSVPEHDRRDFFCYIDEFQSFTTRSVVNMISELRKFRVALTLAHQHLAQLELDVRHAVLGNVGSMIAFRIGPEDAVLIGKEFEPTFAPHDLINLPNHSVLVKLMIDGAPSRPFSAITLSPDETVRL